MDNSNLSKKDSLLIAERFEEKKCLSNFKDYLANQSHKLELVMKILFYLSNQDINYLQYFSNIEFLDIRGVKSQPIFSNLNHQNSLT